MAENETASSNAKENADRRNEEQAEFDRVKKSIDDYGLIMQA